VYLDVDVHTYACLFYVVLVTFLSDILLSVLTSSLPSMFPPLSFILLLIVSYCSHTILLLLSRIVFELLSLIYVACTRSLDTILLTMHSSCVRACVRVCVCVCVCVCARV
jgi:hypothetical protein